MQPRTRRGLTDQRTSLCWWRSFAFVVSVVAGAACRPDASPTADHRVRFLHTFSPRQASHVAALLAQKFSDVDLVAVPFARGRQVLRANVASPEHCPDLARIDATWLPELVDADLLQPPPSNFRAADWTPIAQALASYHSQLWAVPHSIDGLVVARRPPLPPPTATTIAALLGAIAQQPTRANQWRMQLRADGYWMVPWLRSETTLFHSGLPTVAQLTEQQAALARALATFADLFAGAAAPRPPNGTEATIEASRFVDGNVGYWIAGSWQLGELAPELDVAVTALPQAPVGAQLFVVPRCAVHSVRAWQLVATLTSPAALLRLAEQDGLVSPAAVADPQLPGRLQAIRAALQSGEPLPQAAATPRLFDDLAPAMMAVIDHEATADEAAAGLVRSWTRVLGGQP
jgi:ABC-type glycerol-3-phosphate transport system substrate-binding protein